MRFKENVIYDSWSVITNPRDNLIDEPLTLIEKRAGQWRYVVPCYMFTDHNAYSTVHVRDKLCHTVREKIIDI